MSKRRTITCISYGDKRYRAAGRLNLITAKKYGADKTVLYGPKDLSLFFIMRNILHFIRKHGAGYWVWKPYIILKEMSKMKEGDILIYSDAGSVFINDICSIIKVFDRDNLFFMPFSLNVKEKYWTKRDALTIMFADYPEITETFQRLATFIILKKCRESESLVREWLHHCENIFVVSGFRNFFGKPNYSGYVASRNDQTALSIITKKRGIQAYRDPSQYGSDVDTFDEDLIKRSDYPQIWYSTRNPKIVSMKQLNDILSKQEGYM